MAYPSHFPSWKLGATVAVLAVMTGCAQYPFAAPRPASRSASLPATSGSRDDTSRTNASSTSLTGEESKRTGSAGELAAARRSPPLDSGPSSSPPPTAQPAPSGSVSAEQLTELDLQALDRALNGSDSSLPPAYQQYLRAQLAAIAGRQEPPSHHSEPQQIPPGPRSEEMPAAPVPAGPSPNSGGTLAAHAVPVPSPTHPSATPSSSSNTGPASAPPPQSNGPPNAVPVSGGGSTVAAGPAPAAAAAPTHVTVATATTPMTTASPGIPGAVPPATATVEQRGIPVTDPASPAEKAPVAKGEWREHLLRTVDALEQELARYSFSDREAAHLATSARLLHLLANHREKSVAAIESMGEDEREYWKHQIHALLIALDAEDKHASSRRAALALRELQSAAHHLANLSTLDVRNLAFCEEVISFGVYTPVKSLNFRPGQPVLLYVELDNFTVLQTGNRYETKFQAEYNIVDADGGRMNKKLHLVEEKEGRNRRHDYFISYQLEIPADLAPGAYTLQLIIEDVIGKKSSEASIDFRVR